MKKLVDKTCPVCGAKLELKNGDQLYCSKCIHYKINGVWKHIWCDAYHQHNAECLFEIKELNK